MAGWQDPENFAIGLFIAMMIVILMITGIVVITQVYFRRIIQEQEKLAKSKVEHQRELLWSSVLVQEKERERIAADLHDGLISKLTVLKYAIQTNNEKFKPAEMLQDSIKIAREITHDLSPPLLGELSFYELVESFVSPLSGAYTIENYYRHIGDYHHKNEIKLQLLRIVQEIVNNTLKHAKATKLEFLIRVTTTSTALIIRDNGVGFDVKLKANGLGLKNIELRSQLLNARSRFKSKPNFGSTFQLYLKHDLIPSLT